MGRVSDTGQELKQQAALTIKEGQSHRAHRKTHLNFWVWDGIRETSRDSFSGR